MSKLVPTVVTDKNGRTTTVHKKPASAPASKTLNAASPVSATRPRLDDDAVNYVILALGLRPDFIAPKVKENITTLSMSDVDLIRDALASVKDYPYEMQANIISCLNQPDEHGRHLRNSLVLKGSSLPVNQHPMFLRTIGKHETFKESSYDLEAADDTAKKFILKIADAVHSFKDDEKFVRTQKGGEDRQPMITFTEKYMRFREPEVLQAMLDNPEHADRVAALYHERGNIDALSEVLSSSTAISGGAL